jgi:hypothetical protein
VANGARNVLDASTRNADGVVVIVSNLGFKTSRVPRKINTTQKPGFHEIVEHHVRGLQRKLWEFGQGVAVNFFRSSVRMPLGGFQNA